MTPNLNGKEIAILVDSGFEQEEMMRPRQALEDAGTQTYLISRHWPTVEAWNHHDWGDSFPVDFTLRAANPEDFDALMLPGGVMNPDQLRINEEALDFVRTFFDAGKPVVAICHAPWTLIDAGVVRGRRMTSYPSLKTDLRNAGADWVNEEVVVDNGLVTSRNPDDIPAFNEKMIEEFAEGIHERRNV